MYTLCNNGQNQGTYTSVITQFPFFVWKRLNDIISAIQIFSNTLIKELACYTIRCPEPSLYIIVLPIFFPSLLIFFLSTLPVPALLFPPAQHAACSATCFPSHDSFPDNLPNYANSLGSFASFVHHPWPPFALWVTLLPSLYGSICPYSLSLFLNQSY